MRVISLYSGGGGIDEGFRQAGIKTSLAVEVDPAACDTLKRNHPEAEVLQSTVQDARDSIGAADLVIGGPPCQAFSRASPTPTYDTTEVDRFWAIVREAGARYWLMENVAQVSRVLKRPDGRNIDVADYGVPQHRVRRIYSNLPVPRRTHGQTKQIALDGRIVEQWTTAGTALGLQDGVLVCTRQYEPRPYPLNRPSVVVLTEPRLWYQPNKRQPKRKLTVPECAALQGFPPTYVFCGTKTEQLRQIGNALPPPVTRAYAAQIVLEVPA